MKGRSPRFVQCLLWTFLLSGCGEEDQRPAAKPIVRADESWPNVVLISVDMLRPDHLGCYGYERNTSPRIDRLAGDGALFRNVISSTSWTLPAHAALFTGLADTVHGCLDTDQRLADSRVTLAERLGEVGYATVGFFSGPYLHPVFGLGQGFDQYVDCSSYPELSNRTIATTGSLEGPPIWQASHEDITSPRIYRRVKDWLDANRRRPFFMFIHMWDVHFDFIPPSPYDRKFDPDYAGTVTGRNFFFDESVNAQMPKRDLGHLIALYDGEIAWTDEHVGKILDELDALGLRDSTIVMLTADHGTEFFEHGDKAHRKTLYDEVIRIPLIIRYPGRVKPGLRFTEQARIIDVLPTILDLLDMPAPADVMGQSLVPLMSGTKLKDDDILAISELFSMGRQLRSFRRPERKLIRDEATGRGAVFDLCADPGELSPLTDAQAPLVRQMVDDAREAMHWLARFREALGAGQAEAGLTPELRAKLESLGYVGTEDDENQDNDHGP